MTTNSRVRIPSRLLWFVGFVATLFVQPRFASSAIQVARYAPALCKIDNPESDFTALALSAAEYQNTRSC